MVQNITLDDKAIIEEALRRMQSDAATIPAEDVRKFMTKIGEEIQRTGELRKEVLNGLLPTMELSDARRALDEKGDNRSRGNLPGLFDHLAAHRRRGHGAIRTTTFTTRKRGGYHDHHANYCRCQR
jgi:hypothetical protein